MTMSMKVPSVSFHSPLDMLHIFQLHLLLLLLLLPYDSPFFCLFFFGLFCSLYFSHDVILPSFLTGCLFTFYFLFVQARARGVLIVKTVFFEECVCVGCLYYLSIYLSIYLLSSYQNHILVATATALYDRKNWISGDIGWDRVGLTMTKSVVDPMTEKRLRS